MMCDSVKEHIRVTDGNTMRRTKGHFLVRNTGLDSLPPLANQQALYLSGPYSNKWKGLFKHHFALHKERERKKKQKPKHT